MGVPFNVTLGIQGGFNILDTYLTDGSDVVIRPPLTGAKIPPSYPIDGNGYSMFPIEMRGWTPGTWNLFIKGEDVNGCGQHSANPRLVTLSN